MKTNLMHFTFSLLLTSLYACAQGEAPSQGQEASTQGQLAAASNTSPSSTSISSDASTSQPLASASQKPLPRLSAADVLQVADEPLAVYSDVSETQKLCELAFGTELLIVDRPEGFLKVRLDRNTQLQSECPANANFGFIKTAQGPSPSTASESVPLSQAPHTLAFDLKVYDTVSKQGEPVCVLAKGTGVLVSIEADPTIQMPKSSHCDESIAKAYFTYQPGLWLEDQPQ